MTAVGDRLYCPNEVSSPTVLMLKSKIHINNNISDFHLGYCYLGINISNFYLGTDIPYHQYMRVHPSKILKEIWDEYEINIAPNGFV